MANQASQFYMTLPFHMMQQEMFLNTASSPSSYTRPPSNPQNIRNRFTNQQQNVPPQLAQVHRPIRINRNEIPVVNEFRIPSLWKRVAAEFIDFFLLFVVKLAVTIFFVEYIGLVDLRHYDLEYLMTADMDYNTAFAMTSELVAMEIVNRVFICMFETLCLRKGFVGAFGGATPGKKLVGLKVISCQEVTNLPGHKVRIVPAGNIGTWNAFVRSVIKNFSLAFFFPVCLTVFFFQHNRAAYDIISNCIVVECEPPQVPQAQRQAAPRAQ